jgi:PAS domain S-box-containing protein
MSGQVYEREGERAPGRGSPGEAVASLLAADFGGRLDDILASISDGLVALDNDWRFTYVNAGAQRFWGRSIDELLGRTIFDSLHVDPNNPFHTNYVAAKRSGEPTVFTAYSDIFHAWLEVRGYPHPGGFAIFFRNVTAERESHLASLERVRSARSESSINQRIFETSLDLILVTDSQGNLRRVSPSSLAILGYRNDEMAGRSGLEFIYHDDLESTRAVMRQARRGKLKTQFDCRYVHRDGHLVPLTWTGVWSEPDQQHFFIGRDMTERVAAEERARHSQRLESIGQLTGGIAHDFNNLLAIVVGSIELIFDQPNLPKQAQEHAHAALHAAERGAELTRRLLAFARQQPLEPKTVDANQLIGNMTRLLARTLGEHIQVSFNPGERLWPVFIDAANLESALANLAVNARDAMPEGGRLMIETHNGVLDDAYAERNPGATPGEYIVVAVTDTGSGMAPEVLHRIFEPFFTTKESGKGTGLGLSMVFGFVKQSGGHIKAYSEIGHGTTMRLYLPRARQAGLPDQPAAPEPRMEAARHERILVVEDNDAIRQLVLMQLATLGYQTLEANGATAAMALLDAGEPVDLLFTDIVMPGGMSGHLLAREAVARRPGLKVLFTSGFPGALVAGNGGMRADTVLGKPYRVHDLARKMREVLGG